MSGTSYRLQLLDITALPQLLELDRRCYGGYWGEQGYRAELERPTSTVIGVVAEPAAVGARVARAEPSFPFPLQTPLRRRRRQKSWWASAFSGVLKKKRISSPWRWIPSTGNRAWAGGFWKNC